ncbi:MAG: hypothetical protein HYY06_06350 [Deltaproteobacteria bacterium]|nr:hypothetical protein [Deltaproteobacteria bacterium]
MSAILVRQCVGVVAGENVHFDVVGFGDHVIPEPDVETDERGISTAIVEVGSQEGSFQVQATALGADPITFTIDVAVPTLRLVVDTPEPIQGVVSSRVTVTYALTTSDAGGEIPVAGEPVRFFIDLGADTGTVLAEEAARTGPTGTATATLRTGPTPGTVELRGEVDGTSPATATILIEDGADGGCRRSADCQPGWECRLGREEDPGECVEVGGGENPDQCVADDECEPGFECRDGRCLEPDFEGEVCEFDDECADGELCIGGFCTPDPRDPPGCEDDADCGRLVCNAGQCICQDARHCPVGWDCGDEGACHPPDGGGDGCVADRDCPDGQICENGDCRDRGACDDPDLSGSWTFDSTLHLRDALPGWLSDLLDAIDGPLRFIADGLINGFDFDVPIIGDALEDAANGLADEYVPDWVGELLGAIADVAEILSTWQVEQDIELFSVGGAEYRGEEEWTRVSFELRGEEVSGTPEDILGWDVSVDDFAARTTCGTLNIDNHDVGIAVGSIIRWVLDVIVTFVSDGEYFSLEDLLYDLSDTVCAELAWALQDLMEAIGDGLDIDLPDLESEFEDYCIEQAETYIDQAITALEEIDVQLDVVELAGQGAIVDEDRLEPGLWQGRLLGGDFGGEFVATRAR